MSATSRIRRAARELAGRSGYDARAVGEGHWLVGRQGSLPLLERVGPRIGLLTDQPHPRGLQRQLGSYLAMQEVLWILERTGANCVMDVGAFRGDFAQALREGGYRGRIVSCEPVPELVDGLLERSAADPEWHVQPYAAGDADGTQTIHVVPGTMSSLLESSEFGRTWRRKLGTSRPQQVEVRRLAALYEEAVAGIDEPRAFLKLDTQGYDLPAFQGIGDHATELVGLMSEVSCLPIYDGMPRLVEQLTAYEAAGFELAGMYPVTIHEESLRVIEFDAVMVRAAAVRPGE